MVESMNILLSGIVGSTAYGLAGPDSDVDRLGIFAFDTEALHGISSPEESKVSTDPDVTFHEIKKYCKLSLSCNPTVLELLWLPSRFYEIQTNLGLELISIRTAFLSRKAVRNSYLGYASQQLTRMTSRNVSNSIDELKNKKAKNARHLARLLHQGTNLYTTGELTIELENPQYFLDFGESVSNGDLRLANEALNNAEAIFNNNSSALPISPRSSIVEAYLKKVRRYYYSQEN